MLSIRVEGRDLNLWMQWYRLVRRFQVSCCRRRTFYHPVLILAGFTVRGEIEGVSRLIRGLGLEGAPYKRLLRFFNDSRALSLDGLTRVWVERDTVQIVGTYGYHFWMREMDAIPRKSKTRYLHRKPPEYRERVDRKREIIATCRAGSSRRG